MHVLLTNDDGPPNEVASPYIRFFVDAIAKYTDWDVSIVVPDVQRSWIGKAHFAGKELTASYIYPNKNSNTFYGPYPSPVTSHEKEGLKEWALTDGTPASCTDIGIHHLYKEKGPVDLVISGPNVGKNTTAAYILSSGTIGAALEGAIRGKKSIGVSYGYVTKDVEDEVLEKASEIAVKLVQYLYDNWDSAAKNEKIDLYSVNVPLVPSILTKGQTKILYAPILQNRWTLTFTRAKDHSGGDSDIVDATASNKIQFRWTPDFDHVHQSIKNSKGLNDGKVIDDGNVSVTPLRATFDEASVTGEIKLDI